MYSCSKVETRRSMINFGMGSHAGVVEMTHGLRGPECQLREESTPRHVSMLSQSGQVHYKHGSTHANASVANRNFTHPRSMKSPPPALLASTLQSARTSSPSNLCRDWKRCNVTPVTRPMVPASSTDFTYTNFGR